MTKQWGDIKEIDMRDTVSQNDRWSSLRSEISLRLERTLPGKALSIPFADYRSAHLAYCSLRKYFDRVEPGRVKMGVKQLGDGAQIYIGWAELKVVRRAYKKKVKPAQLTE